MTEWPVGNRQSRFTQKQLQLISFSVLGVAVLLYLVLGK